MRLDMLTQDSVSVLKQVNNQNWRKSYLNSEQGRQELQAEVTEPYLSEVFAVWGAKPTVIEEVQEPQEPIPTEPTEADKLQQQIETLQGAMDFVILNY